MTTHERCMATPARRYGRLAAWLGLLLLPGGFIIAALVRLGRKARPASRLQSALRPEATVPPSSPA